MVFETKPVMSSFISGGKAREETADARNWLGVSYRSCCLIVFIEEVAEVAGVRVDVGVLGAVGHWRAEVRHSQGRGETLLAAHWRPAGAFHGQ